MGGVGETDWMIKRRKKDGRERGSLNRNKKRNEI